MAQDTLLGFPAHTLPFRRGEFTTLLTVCTFRSAPDQDPKAAKYAVLTPGRAGFPNRAKRSEVIPPPPETPRVSPCEPLCARLGDGVACVYPLSPVKTNVSRLCECDLKPRWRGISHAVWDAHLQRISGRSGGYRRVLFIAG